MMHQKGLHIIDYLDDYIGVGVPHIVRMSFASLFDLTKELGLTMSDKKLVPQVQKWSA